jgi:AsmA protein
MNRRRLLKWGAAVVFGPPLLAALFIAVFGWNWLRAPLSQAVLARTGRVLVIEGDLGLRWSWPAPVLVLGRWRFANPAWAANAQMAEAEAAELAIDATRLLRGALVLRDVRLTRPRLWLERGPDGRRNWLLDRLQQDDGAQLEIGDLHIDQGTLDYDDASRATRVRVRLSSAGAAAAPGAALRFEGEGRYAGMALAFKGTGGAVLKLRDDSLPYPLEVEAAVGRTRVKAAGTITRPAAISALDLKLSLRGDSFEEAYALIGIALPATRAYSLDGRLTHGAGWWRYGNFSGRIGASDVAGDVRFETAGVRPLMRATLASKLLDLDDLGPPIGSLPAPLSAPQPAASGGRVLPALPFNTERWGSADAEVELRAQSIRRVAVLPLTDLSTRLRLREAVLTLDPLELGVAGGHLAGSIVLDGRARPLAAVVRLRARRIAVGSLVPTLRSRRDSAGQINGDIDLAGRGDTVARMLGSADGKVGLVVGGGTISRLMMEKAGLHLWEMLWLNLAGDRPVGLRCAVADFAVGKGVMTPRTLVFDTDITTLSGTGTVDLGTESLDLTFRQRTKSTSPLAVRSPIHVGGSFAHPVAGVDAGPVALRALGAVALGLINPLLALLPLIDAGPGADSDCRALMRLARVGPRRGIAPGAAGKQATVQ